MSQMDSVFIWHTIQHRKIVCSGTFLDFWSVEELFIGHQIRINESYIFKTIYTTVICPHIKHNRNTISDMK